MDTLSLFQSVQMCALNGRVLIQILHCHIPSLPMLFKTRKRRCLAILITVVCFFVLDCIKMSRQEHTLVSQVQCDNDNNKQFIEELVCDLFSVDLYMYVICMYV